MDFYSISSNLLYTAFVIYFIATIFFGATIRSKEESGKSSRAAAVGITLTIIGFIAQLGYFIFRWIAAGHAPVSNLFEFTTFFGMMLVFAFIIIYFLYKLNILGLFALPVAMIIIAYASMFPQELSPLIPALKTHWLYIHVTTAGLGEAILAVSFAAGLIYLIKRVDQSTLNLKTFSLEFVLYMIFATLGFILVTLTFNAMDYEVAFEYRENGEETTTEYHLPAIVAPYDSTMITEDRFGPLFETPAWMEGKEAGRKLNTFIWSLLGGLVLHAFTMLLLRKRVAKALQPLLNKVNLDIVDEIMYRSVAIGFPVFTLGALIFAAIWAQVAWNRFWGWDPKEVWALVTWFFYAAFLHLRLSRGWHGEKSAWLAVIGFAIIMFNLIAVNLVLFGLHSYA